MPDKPSPWLWPCSDSEPTALHRLSAILREYREVHHLSQAALGELLQVDQTYISMIERGRRQIRDVGELLRIARLLGIPPADLGLSNELMTESAGSGRPHEPGRPHGLVASAGVAAALAGASPVRRSRLSLIRPTGGRCGA